MNDIKLLQILGSIHRGMLNAYSRVDKGRLIALDRSDDKSSFGPHIGDAYDLSKNLEKSQNDAEGLDRGPDKPKYENLNYRNDDNGFAQERKGPSTTSANSKASEDDTDSSVIVTDTLLSNLLINSVLSALKKGNTSPDFIYCAVEMYCKSLLAVSNRRKCLYICINTNPCSLLVCFVLF